MSGDPLEPNWNAETVHNMKVFAYFNYMPSRDLSFTAIALFSILLIVNTAMNIRYKCYKQYIYMNALTFIGIMQITGYIFRLVTINEPTLNNFMTMQILVMLSPNVFIFVNYNVLNKVMYIINVHKKWHRILIGSFLLYYVAVFAIQINGLVLMFSTDPNDLRQGIIYLVIGTVLQILYLTLLFPAVFAVQKSTWNNLLIFATMYFQFACLLVRSMYKIIGLSSTKLDSINQSEHMFYLLDAGMILLVYISYALVPYPRYLDAMQIKF